MKSNLKINFIILLIATFFSKLFGFIREMLIASKIGVSIEFDVLLSVFVIPNMIITLLLYALPHIVIPRLNLKESSDNIFLY